MKYNQTPYLQLDLANATHCEKHYSYNGKDIVMYLTIEYPGKIEKLPYTSESAMQKDYKKILQRIDKNIPITPFSPGIKPRHERKLRGVLQG